MADEEADEASDEEDTLLTPELREWRSRVSECRNVEDMHALISQLSKALAWDKSIMKVTCQICKRDDNESELLLCDGCDLGFHSYCFRPRMPSVPDADDWFCFVCVALVTRTRRCFICGQLGPGRLRDGSESLGPQLLTCSSCTRSMHLECCLPIDASSSDALAAAQSLASTRITRSWLCRHCSEAAQLEKDQQQRSSSERTARGGGRRGGRGDSNCSASNGPSSSRRQQSKAEVEAPARSKSPSSSSEDASDDKTSAAHQQRQRVSARDRQDSSSASVEQKPARKRRGMKAEGTQNKKARLTDSKATPLAADNEDSAQSSVNSPDGVVQQSPTSSGGRKRVYKRKSSSTESSDVVAEQQSSASASSDDAKLLTNASGTKRSPKKAKRETSDDGEKSNKRTENGPQPSDAPVNAYATSSTYRPLKIKLKKAASPLTNSVSGASEVNASSCAANGESLASHNSVPRAPPHAKPLLAASDACDSVPLAFANSTANTHFHQQLDGVSSVRPVAAAGGPSCDMGPCWTLLAEFEQHPLSGPFSKPVDARKFPTYRVVITHPMDISTLRSKLKANWFVFECLLCLRTVLVIRKISAT